MTYQDIKPTSPKATKLQLTGTNIGTGGGLFKGFNGPLMEFRSIDATNGLKVTTDPDDKRIIVDGGVLKNELERLCIKISELSTTLNLNNVKILREHERTQHRLKELEFKELPEGLKLLDQLPKFHGCVPVIENGKWAALNLSNDFFLKYETKLTALNMELDALVLNDIDIRERANALADEVEEIRELAYKLRKTYLINYKDFLNGQMGLCILGCITTIIAISALYRTFI